MPMMLVSLCRLSTSTSSAAAAALASAFLSRARLFSSSPPPPLPRKKTKASGSNKHPPPLSGAARRSLALYRSALRASRLQPTPESKETLAKTARSLIERSRNVDSQTAEHLQRRGARQLDLVGSGAAVLGTVRV